MNMQAKIVSLCAFIFVVFWQSTLTFAAHEITSHSDKKIKVFLLAGQSNMDGRGDGSMLTMGDRARLGAVQNRVLFAYNNREIVPLAVTTPQLWIAKKFNLDLTFGPELFFGLNVAEAWPDSEILLIKRSQGGTSLYGCWNPDWSLEKATLMGEEEQPRLYNELVAYVHDVLSRYQEDEYEIVGMLWVQGEADSGVKKYGPLPAETYGDNLRNLIVALRGELDTPDLPFFMLQVGGGKVVEGMISTADSLENVFYIPQSRDPEAANYLPKYGPPIGHYTYEGMKRIGILFSEEFLSYATKHDMPE